MHKVIDLPYDLDALEPHISKKVMDLHYNKHNKGYINKLNHLIKNTDYKDLNLAKTIMKSIDNEDMDIYNNAGQSFNHNYYWESISPDGGGKPSGKLMDAINKYFGSYKSFCDKFVAEGTAQFGSGWLWLFVSSDGELMLDTYDNAGSPLGLVPEDRLLLAVDVWEHAYYIDYENRRGEYLEVFLDKVVNWKFAEERFEKI